MKKVWILLMAFAPLAGLAQGGLLKKAGDLLKKSGSSQGQLSTDEVVQGLKEALSQGATQGAGKLSAVDGFFGNAAIKILMPAEAKKVESTLRSAGMGNLVDKAVLSMNRAAEEASKSAAPIFLDAIKQMSFQDAWSILRGTDSAATVYLKGKTWEQLAKAFRPVIEQALQKTDATRYWKDVFDSYNKVPFARKVNPDLAGYVTDKALQGMFVQVALEEKKIRKDPAARATDLLKKVFGS